MRLFAQEKEIKRSHKSDFPPKIILKPEINIETIGAKRFYAGIIVAIILLLSNILINILSSSHLAITLDQPGFKIFRKMQFTDYLLDAAVISSITIFIWFFNKKWEESGSKVKQRYISINIIFSIIIFLLAKIGLFLFMRNFLPQIASIAVGILALLIYSGNWNSIRLIFRTKKWRLINLAIIIVYAVIMTSFN